MMIQIGPWGGMIVKIIEASSLTQHVQEKVAILVGRKERLLPGLKSCA